MCEWCHKREAEQRHHCLIHDSKRFHGELTVKENLMAVCAYCHTGECLLNGYDIRLWFWSIQCERYGIDHMLDWLESLPVKLRYSRRIDFVDVSEKRRVGTSSVSTNKAQPFATGRISITPHDSMVK